MIRDGVRRVAQRMANRDPQAMALLRYATGDEAPLPEGHNDPIGAYAEMVAHTAHVAAELLEETGFDPHAGMLVLTCSATYAASFGNAISPHQVLPLALREEQEKAVQDAALSLLSSIGIYTPQKKEAASTATT